MASFLRAAVAFGFVLASTLAHTAVLFAFALLKLLLPVAAARRWLSRVLVRIAESWIAVNSRLIAWFTPTRFEIEGLDELDRGGWYLVISNHQSWVDIPVLQKVFNRRVPFLKFFLKDTLIWVPLLGLAWWALDFPFMKRYSQQQLEKHPELRGTDQEATRLACRRFSRIPTSVMNFVEGTRYTEEKFVRQAPPFRHLLRPKAGGIAFVMASMGDILQSLLDVTIVYPGGRPSVYDLFAGRIAIVRVHVRRRSVPVELTNGDYENDEQFRRRFQAWINAVWAEKEAQIARMLAAP